MNQANAIVKRTITTTTTVVTVETVEYITAPAPAPAPAPADVVLEWLRLNAKFNPLTNCYIHQPQERSDLSRIKISNNLLCIEQSDFDGEDCHSWTLTFEEFIKGFMIHY